MSPLKKLLKEKSYQNFTKNDKLALNNQILFPNFLHQYIFQNQLIKLQSIPNSTCKKANTKSISEARLNELKKNIKPENLAEIRCDPSDIYCLCKFHPKYKNCVCVAFPKSVVCSSTFCFENKNSYECNPLMCDNPINKNSSQCFCRKNINNLKCKCKLNPHHKDCFCMKFPFSHMCNDKICQFNPNSLFCKCKIIPGDPICSPKYCIDNPKSPHCECLLNPYNKNCKCINDPNSCSSNN